MEYVNGEPITSYCDRQRLTTQERLQSFTQIYEGVQHAHEKGVMHRDLKPSNVLVAIFNLATGLWYQGKYSDADAPNKEVADRRERVLGERHRDTDRCAGDTRPHPSRKRAHRVRAG